MSGMKDLFDGWKSLLTGDKSDEDIVQERAALCKVCPKNTMGVCWLCGCYIPAKIRAMESECPAGKWNERP